MVTRVRIFAVCLHRCLSCLMMHTFAAARCSSIFCSRIFPICYGGKKRAQFTTTPFCMYRFFVIDILHRLLDSIDLYISDILQTPKF